MPTHKRTVHPGQPTPVAPPIAEPAGSWDLDPHWADDQAEIDQWSLDDTGDTREDVDDAEDQL
jgi:hypothetical protein